MNRVVVYYDDLYLEHKALGYHPENPDRLVAIMNELKREGTLDKVELRKPTEVSSNILTIVHKPSYVKRIEGMRGYVDPDTYVGEGSIRAAYYAAGALENALKLVNDEKIYRIFCLVRPPGHHATSERAMGFCIFNNVAVGAQTALLNKFKKVLIIDFDVHHGNGTQEIFYENPDVFYFSTHQYPFYPGTGSEDEKGRGEGEGTTLNVPLPAGCGDSEYEKVYNTKIPFVKDTFAPDIVFVSAGYDLLFSDPLGGMKVSLEGVKKIVEIILRNFEDKPIIFALEGGYDIEGLAKCVNTTISLMLQI